jgi:hypothetical protein
MATTGISPEETINGVSKSTQTRMRKNKAQLLNKMVNKKIYSKTFPKQEFQ